MLDLTKPYVINAGSVPKHVGIIRISDGATGSIRVMGRGKVNIPDGFKKDGNWLALYGDKINAVEPASAPSAAPVVTQNSSAATVTEETPASTVQASETEATKGE